MAVFVQMKVTRTNVCANQAIRELTVEMPFLTYVNYSHVKMEEPV